ncbi:uncharacterized protein LOC108669069 [Hyalella azteca]|uniref:Uncharacterized protein LOC108669069 n=1 Tax=Hyalella azteca TaxID=294128 RepID=A0A8B7NE07_HYAAZ|nr:uncharacterized protein LOC108669069 [Hyalella azteca]
MSDVFTRRLRSVGVSCRARAHPQQEGTARELREMGTHWLPPSGVGMPSDGPPRIEPHKSPSPKRHIKFLDSRVYHLKEVRWIDDPSLGSGCSYTWLNHYLWLLMLVSFMVLTLPCASSAGHDSGYNVNYALSVDYRNGGNENTHNNEHIGEEYPNVGAPSGARPQHANGAQFPNGPPYKEDNRPPGEEYEEHDKEHEYGKPAVAPPVADPRIPSEGDYVTLNNQNKFNVNRNNYNNRKTHNPGHHYYGSRTGESRNNPYGKHNYVNHTPYDVAAEKAQRELNLGKTGDSRIGGKVAAVHAVMDTTPTPPIEYHFPIGQHCQFDEDDEGCKWVWDPADPIRNLAGFEVVSGTSLRQQRGPDASEFMFMPAADYMGSKDGQFLFMGLYPRTNYSNTMAQIRSPYFLESGDKCRLEVHVNIRGFHDVTNPVRMLIQTNHTPYVIMDINNDTRENNIRIREIICVGELGMTSNAPLQLGMTSNVPPQLGMTSNVPHSWLGMTSNVPLQLGMTSNVPPQLGMTSNVPLQLGMTSNVPPQLGMTSNVLFRAGHGL